MTHPLQDLQNSLRCLIQQRIRVGAVSGSLLARRTGFQQAHISNFLRGRRGLSFAAFDKVLDALNLTLDELEAFAEPSRPNLPHHLTLIPLVSLDIAHYPAIGGSDAGEHLAYRRTLLQHLRAAPAGNRLHWARFLAVRAGADAATAMRPLIRNHSDLLVDRHYNSLDTFRPGHPNLYLVRTGSGRNLVRYLQLQGEQLFLRPLNPAVPLDFLIIESGRRAEDSILGRICHIGGEL
jgi:transcriptional regulator with XRE-family HTH domain